MRNQIFGNYEEYGKYGLWRFLSEQGVSLFVNWYLTRDIEGSKNELPQYLGDAKFWKYDPELYRFLKEYVFLQNKREVAILEDTGLFPGTVFYRELLDFDWSKTREERNIQRAEWHKKALSASEGAGLVFLDPDNGVRKTEPRLLKDTVRYAFLTEAADYYQQGAQLCCHCPKSRRNEAQWEAVKRMLKEGLPDAAVFGIRTKEKLQKSYLFAVHPGQEEKYRKWLDEFLHTGWEDFFDAEEM